MITTIHAAMLTRLCREGHVEEAIRIACSWTSHRLDTSNSLHMARYDAARELIRTQTMFPLCPHCTWPLLPGEQHDYCEQQLRLNDGVDTEALGLTDIAALVAANDIDGTWPEDNSDDELCSCGQPRDACSCYELGIWRDNRSNPHTSGEAWAA